MDDRVKPWAKGIGAKTWDGFDPNLSEAQNVTNNRAWVEQMKREGYTIYDIGLDEAYTAKGDFDKGPYYGVEAQVFFGDP